MRKMRLMFLLRWMFLLGLSVLAVGLVIGTTIGIDSCEFPPWVGLEGTWVLKCYGEPGKLRLPYPAGIRCRGYITLTLSARDYEITTDAGVNRCFGNYEVDGNKFSAAHLKCWERYGPSHLMVQEDHYKAILTSAQTYEITDCILIISSGKEVLVFTRLGSYEHARRRDALPLAKE